MDFRDAQLALQRDVIAQGSADVAAAEANLKFAQEEQARYAGSPLRTASLPQTHKGDYVAAKHGLVGLTKVVGLETARPPASA